MNDWIAVATEGELFEGAAIAVTPIDDEIAIYKTEAGEVFATDNICTHEAMAGCATAGWRAMKSNARCTRAASTSAVAKPRWRRARTRSAATPPRSRTVGCGCVWSIERYTNRSCRRLLDGRRWPKTS